MLKRFDKYDRYSLITLVISAIACAYLIYRGIQLEKPEDDTLILIISITSSVVSIGGLIIAVLQIFKVSSNTIAYKEAYDKTVRSMVNNESISLLSKLLQQVNMIKYHFEKQSETDARSYFNNLFLDLTLLQNNKNINTIEKEKLEYFISYCIEMDTLIFKDITGVENEIDYSIKYETLTEIQSLLTILQQKLTTPIEN